MKEIVINEDKFSTKTVKEIPIDIESTLIGADMNCLLSTISGVETVAAYGDVSFRILNRIADLLMCQP